MYARLRPKRRRVSTVVIGAALLVTGACSVDVDDEPRAWSNWVRFDDSPEGSPSGFERIYLIDGSTDSTDRRAMLTTVRRDLPANTPLYRGLLDVLFEGPTTDEVVQGLRTSIPTGLSLFGEPGVEQRGTVVVDLSEQLTAALGDDLTDALAQIVWTLCERPEISQVRILVEGRRVPWNRADGTVLDRPLTPFDFPAFAIATQPDFPGIIEPPV